MRKAIVTLESTLGGFGNVMLTAAHIAAFTIENDFDLFLLPLYRYATLLENLYANPLCRMPPRRGLVLPPEVRTLIFRACRKLRHLLQPSGSARRCAIYELDWEGTCLLQDPAVSAEIRKKGFGVFSGFRFRAWDLVEKHEEQLRRWFAFRRMHQEAIQPVVNRLRSEADVLVAVHCRGGDYARYLKGVYCYTASQYLAIIDRVRELLQPKRVVFLICTNDETYRKGMQPADVTFSSGRMADDLCLLAQADYIIGPPSTFTLWPAFIGQVPFLHLQSADQEFTIEDFQKSSNLSYSIDYAVDYFSPL